MTFYVGGVAVGSSGGATITSISTSKVTVPANAFSSYYTAPNPGFVVLWYHGTAGIASARNGGQTRIQNAHVFTDPNGQQTSIADTLHVLQVGVV